MRKTKEASKPHPLDDILSTATTPTPSRAKAAKAAKAVRARPPREEVAPAPRPPARRARGEEPQTPKSEPREGEEAELTAAEPSDSWNATHARVTFHCPVALLESIYAEVKDRRRSLSRAERRAFGRTRVIVEILARHYGQAQNQN